MNKWECKGIVSFYKDDKEASIFKFEKAMKMSFTLKVNKCGFLECETWNKNIINGINSGDLVELISYRIVKSSWQDKTTGEKKYKTSIIVDECKKLANGGGEASNGGFIDESGDNDLVSNNELESELENVTIDFNEVEKDLEEVQKEFDNLPSENESGKSDSVSLDWLDEVGE